MQKKVKVKQKTEKKKGKKKEWRKGPVEERLSHALVKGIDAGVVIERVRLLEKTKGPPPAS